jgi:transcriptional regulator with XRE-family HTH domain
MGDTQTATMTALLARGAGALIRDGRQRARLSQLELANLAGVSARHLGFVELGRSRPSPELLLLLAHHLDVPLRERNEWLVAAGYAPRFAQTPLEGEALARVRRSLQALLDAHDPFPGMVVDRTWTVQLANRAANRLADDIPPEARHVPSNVFRISLHPQGFAPRTHNFADWSGCLLRQLDLAVRRTNDPALVELAREVEGWPDIPPRQTWPGPSTSDHRDPVIPWNLELGGEELFLYSTISTFGTPLDVTLSELAIELFFPADEATEAVLRRWAASAPDNVREMRPTGT